MNDSHLEEWFGLPVEEVTSETDFDFAGKVYRFGFTYDTEEDPAPMLEQFLNSSGVENTVAIVLGMEGESDTPLDGFMDVLEANKSKLPNLRGLFIGDITQEENEMSWINQTTISRALQSFPGLEELRSRGGEKLQFEPTRHIGLTKLVIETGGMPKTVLEGIAGSVLPELEHLELWLGTDEYGWDGSMEDVLPILNPALFPKLKHLALGNSVLQNEIAAAVADSPLLDQLESLDLSLGVMTDAGAEPLLNSAGIKKLKHLNLHRNYLTTATTERFKALGISVDVEGQEAPDEYDGELNYYVAVGE